MNSVQFYSEVAKLNCAIKSCVKRENLFWEEKHRENLSWLLVRYLPNGSGFDSGVVFNDKKSNSKKLVFEFDYHMMDGNGYYVGWYHYVVTVEADLALDFTIKISGKNKSGIKEYFADVFGNIA